MRILVTGGAGYLGSVLCELLSRSGHRVRAFDSLMHGGRSLLGLAGREGFEFQRGDMRDADAVQQGARAASTPSCTWPRSWATRPARRSPSWRAP